MSEDIFNTDDDSFDSLKPPFKPNVWYDAGFTWYGVDKTGSIGIFQAGELPIPSKIFTNETAYRELDHFFRELPQTTTAELASGTIREIKTVIGKPVDYSDCLMEASKGLYFIKEINTFLETRKTFWRVEKQYLDGYYLIAIPNKKLHILDLPEKFRLYLKSCQFPIDFSETEKIDVVKYLVCD